MIFNIFSEPYNLKNINPKISIIIPIIFVINKAEYILLSILLTFSFGKYARDITIKKKKQHIENDTLTNMTATYHNNCNIITLNLKFLFFNFISLFLNVAF